MLTATANLTEPPGSIDDRIQRLAAVAPARSAGQLHTVAAYSPREDSRLNPLPDSCSQFPASHEERGLFGVFILPSTVMYVRCGTSLRHTPCITAATRKFRSTSYRPIRA